jgi:glycyl-tRNA synthetase beta chain
VSELLLELFSEEIPAMMQNNAAKAYEKIFIQYFNSLQINFHSIEVHAGARRLSIYVNGLPLIIPASVSEVKGPKKSAPSAAIDGFCKSNDIKTSDLSIKKVNGTDFYFYFPKTAERKTEDILINSLSKPIAEYVWSKSMYWGEYKIKWVRPLKNILCIFNGKIVPFEYGHLKANNICYGHRFMSPKSAQISSYDEYKRHLKDNFVILKAEDRANIIKNAIKNIANDKGLIIKDDPYLIEEVSGLVEYPVILMGRIDEKFLSVPSEVLVSAMRSHQKYFSLFNAEGNFAPYFIFVANIKSENEAQVIAGNEKVLSARLADALYFYNQDLKTSLLEKSASLDKVIFHAKLGSLKDKTERLAKLCKFIAPNNDSAHKAALLCKSDIVSEVVGEFPTLQGIMGYYYAVAESQNTDIAKAIRDHYKPQGANDECSTGISAILALADKVDSLCGLILAGEKPNGSKDPYALRRQALGIIRIILENKLQIELKHLVIFALGLYKDKMEVYDTHKIQVLQFLSDRVKYFFKSEYPSELISSVLDLQEESNLCNLVDKISILHKLLNSDHGTKLIQAYKRANNILGNNKFSGKIDASLFVSPYEKELLNCIKLNKEKIQILLDKKDYTQSFLLLSSFHQPLSDFFENILVKDKNELIAQNRILLLQEVRAIFNQFAKFDEL